MALDRSYRIIITTVALALFTLFWTTIDGQLKLLDGRLRCVEMQLSAISARLGVDPSAYRLNQSSAATPRGIDAEAALGSLSHSQEIEPQNE